MFSLNIKNAVLHEIAQEIPPMQFYFIKLQNIRQTEPLSNEMSRQLMNDDNNRTAQNVYSMKTQQQTK